MLTNLRIGTRLAVGFGLILALLLAIAGVGINRMGSIAADTERIVTHCNLQNNPARDMSEQIQIVARLPRTVRLMDNMADKKDNAARMAKARTANCSPSMLPHPDHVIVATVLI